jgi:hypothetical protein
MINHWGEEGRRRSWQREKVFQMLRSVDAKNRINDRSMVILNRLFSLMSFLWV